MQDFVMEYMKDPVQGSKMMGWEDYKSDQLLRFASDIKLSRV
jgi:hypothetical protein